MTSKERLLAVLQGKEPDRVPYAPFLAYFWEAQPESVRRAGQLAFLEEIGADPLFRGPCVCHRLERRGTDVTDHTEGTQRVVRFATPVGTLTEKYVYTESSNSWFLKEHSVGDLAGLRTLTWMYGHTEVIPDFSQLDTILGEIGERGAVLAMLGAENKTCFQSMVERWMGTESLVYLLMDYPDEVEECLAVMQRVSMEAVKNAAGASVPGFIPFEDTSSTNINPDMFRRYILPELNAWADVIRENRQVLVHHACGHLRALLPFMAESRVDFVESISPPPTGNISVAEARAMLPRRIGVIGGIEPTFLRSCSREELSACVAELLEVTAGTGFIIGNSDSCPPDVPVDTLRAIGELVRHTPYAGNH